MPSLITKVKQLQKSDISKKVNQRILEFQKPKTEKEIFSELCFCLLTANYQAEKSIQIQKELQEDFHTATEKALAEKLKKAGHRFWPQRAERIVLARQHKKNLSEQIKKSEKELREWIVKNVKGLGMKEASHFLRNIGFENSAIIDFHILDILERENLIQKPKTLTPKKYLEIEEQLKKLANKLNLNLAELDLYLWYLETGKILK